MRRAAAVTVAAAFVLIGTIVVGCRHRGSRSPDEAATSSGTVDGGSAFEDGGAPAPRPLFTAEPGDVHL